MFAGAPWSFAFSSGVLGFSLPNFLIEALALLGVMTALPGRAGRVSIGTLGWPATLAIVLAALIALGALFRLLQSLPGIMLPLLPLLRITGLLALPTLVAMIALPPLALLALWPRSGEAVDTTPPPRPARPLPLVGLAIIAAMLTLAVLFVALDEMRGMLLFMPMMIVPIGLPSFAVYGLVVLTVYLLIDRRGPLAYAALGLTLLVFGSWGWQFIAERQARIDDEAAIAATAVMPLPAGLPDAVLLETADNQPMFTLLARGDIAMVIEKQGDKLVANTRTSGSYPRREPLAAMPQRYLHLIAGRDSSFTADRTRYQFATPFELRLVGPGQNDLLGVWYRREILLPRIPPVLNLNGGWMLQQTVLHRQVDDLLTAFLDRTLGVAPPPPPVEPEPAKAAPTKAKRKTLMDLLYGEAPQPVAARN
jgi:hypothetical protein